MALSHGQSKAFVNQKNIDTGIVTSNLVLLLDAQRSYAGSGSTWFDFSGYNKHSILTNNPTFSSSFGGMITTDGTTSCIITPKILGTGTSTYSQSYCVWVRPNDTAGNILSMSNVNPQGSWNMPPICASSSKFTGQIYAASTLTASSTYTNGNWYYVCLVFYYDPTQANRYQRLYVNGILEAEQTNISYTGSGSDNYIFFGQQNPGVGNVGMFAGNYGSIQIYTNKALTLTEIQQNYNALRGRFGL